jgi:hypothetical protein
MRNKLISLEIARHPLGFFLEVRGTDLAFIE